MIHPERFDRQPEPNRKSLNTISGLAVLGLLTAVYVTAKLHEYRKEDGNNPVDQEKEEKKKQLHTRWNVFDRSYQSIKDEKDGLNKLFMKLVRDPQVFDPRSNKPTRFIEEETAEMKSLKERNQRVFGLPERLEELKEAGVGIPIYWWNVKAKEGEESHTFVGMALKINSNSINRQLLVFNNGQSFVIEPMPKADSEDYEELFRKRADTSYIYQQSQKTGVDELGRIKPQSTKYFLNGLKSNKLIRVVSSNDDYKHRDQWIDATEKALKTIAYDQQMKKKRAFDKEVNGEVKKFGLEIDAENQTRWQHRFDEIATGLDVDWENAVALYEEDNRWEKLNAITRKEVAAADADTQTQEELNTLNEKAEAFLSIRESLDLLGKEGIGTRIIRVNLNDRKKSELFGLSFPIKEDENSRSALVVTRKNISVVEVKYNSLAAGKFKSLFSQRGEITFLQRNETYSNNRASLNYAARIFAGELKKYGAEIKLDSNNQHDEDPLFIAVKEVQSKIERIREERDLFLRSISGNDGETIVEFKDQKEPDKEPPIQDAA